MSANNYGEIFCQAAEILAQNLIQKVSYDQTVLCTIVDDSEKSLGKYRVSTGEVIFDAYTSDTSFKKDNQVYVSIPNGDWNEQKLIVAKKMNNINQPITYKDPFDSFIDISNNLINTPINIQGLIANDSATRQILLWSYSGNEILGGYTRLALSADFKAWLKQLGTAVGEYGLNLIIETEPEDIAEIEDDGKKPYSNIKVCNLNSYDMIGNPYNFESFYNQKKLFDISDLKNIKSMELWFYQKEGSFFNQEGILIPHENKPPNIFVKEPVIALGYNTNDFENDTLILYTLNSQKYDVKKDPLFDNHKKLQIRWIHKFNNGEIKVVQPEDDINYELYWYRQELGARSHTVWSGVDWTPLSSQVVENKEIKYEILNSNWNEYNKNAIEGISKDPIRKLSYNQSWLLPDTTLAEEKIKVVLTYGTEVLHSNTIIFSNVSEVVNKATMDALQALTINCEDNSFGNYLIYGLGGNILDSANSKQIREFKAYFNSASDKINNNELAELTEANTIEWIIPTENTMILVEDFISGSDHNYKDEYGYQHIFRYGANLYNAANNSVASGDANIVNQNSQRYKIENQYDNGKTDNTIKCIVTKNGVQYTAIKELTFGPAGTSGTDYTFVIDFISNESALTLKSDFTNEEVIPAVIAQARLYDYTGKEIPNLEVKDIEWSILNKDNKIITENNFIKLFPVEEENVEHEKYIVKNKIELQLFDSVENVPDNNYTILKATLKASDGNNNGWGDYDLHAYLPVPIRSSRKYPFISGATNIFYNSSGELKDFYQNPYVLYYKENNNSALTTINNSIWKIFSDKENDPYAPKISSGVNGYTLSPLSFYVKNSMENLCVIGYNNEDPVWSQPIYTSQNNYPSSILNKWDGQLAIDKENNSITAAKIAAGKKNDDNTFSGVIIGDWKGNDTSSADDSITENTGIYGFQHGITSFGFRDDGTAFIGMPGRGRIEINEEDNSTIQSSSFRHNLGGMLIDFDDALIEMYEPNKKHNKNKSIILNAKEESTPFTIGTNFKVKWNGSLEATDGNFSGTIYADDGVLGNLTLEGNLEASEGYIDGATITGGTIIGSDIYFGSSEGYVYDLYEVIYHPDGTREKGAFKGTQTFTSKLEFGTYPVKNNSWLEYKEYTNGTKTGHLGAGRGNDGTESTETELLELAITNDFIPLILKAKQRVLMMSETMVGMSSGPTWNNGLINIDSNGAIYIRSDKEGNNSNPGGIVNIIGSEKINIGSNDEEMGSISKNITITANQLNVNVPKEKQYGIYARFA